MIEVACEGAFRVLTIDRQDKANSLTAGMLNDLADAVEAASADDGLRALVLTGRGKVFSDMPVSGLAASVILLAHPKGRVTRPFHPTQRRRPAGSVPAGLRLNFCTRQVLLANGVNSSTRTPLKSLTGRRREPFGVTGAQLTHSLHGTLEPPRFRLQDRL